jgi:hypothetical protein
MGSSGIRRRLTGTDAFGSASALVRAFVAAGLAVPLATGVLGPAGPVSAATSGWHIQPTPNPPSTGGVLAADSCASPTACMAVGSYRNGSRAFPLAERWNGTSWSLLKPPVPTGAGDTSLLGVSCVSANACIAVGSYRSKSGNVLTLAEAWNGTSWSIQPTPNHGAVNALASVSCTSANACTAVGYAGTFGGLDSVLTLAEAWNGTTWSIQPTPTPAHPGAANLTGVSCTSPSSCIAVGAAIFTVPIAERWDGTSWSLLKVPLPAGAQAGLLASVSCPAAASCVAVGNYLSGSGRRTVLAETWNGTAWAIRPAAVPPGASRSYLNGVSCLSPASCTAVGNYQSGKHSHVTLAERWNGSAWSIQATPNPPVPRSGLSAVTCLSASFCAAVGSQTSRWQNQAPLAQAWNGTAWSIEQVPAPPSATASFLFGVACPAATDCFSVGQGGGNAGHAALIQHWDGSSWSIERTPLTGGAQSSLFGISCTSGTACTAVGTVSGPRFTHTLAERWNGSSWSVQRTLSVPPPSDNVLDAVSCVSAGSCVAVGIAGNSPAVPLAEVWNGTAWSMRPPAVGQGDSGLAGVSCTSASNCIGVGFGGVTSGGQGPLAERWNGTSWSIQPVPLPAGAARAFLNSVSCTSASACIAVGSSLDSASNNSPLAERWDGTSWSIQQTRAPAGGQAVILNGVSCPSATSCTAVGSYQASGVPFTLAETWDGNSWSVQPTANPAGADDRALSGVSCRSAGVCTAVGYFSKRVGNLGASKTQTLAEAEP